MKPAAVSEKKNAGLAGGFNLPGQLPLFNGRKIIPDVFQHQPPVFIKIGIGYPVLGDVGRMVAAVAVRAVLARPPEALPFVQIADFGLKAAVEVLKPDESI